MAGGNGGGIQNVDLVAVAAAVGAPKGCTRGGGGDGTLAGGGVSAKAAGGECGGRLAASSAASPPPIDGPAPTTPIGSSPSTLLALPTLQRS